MKWKDRFLSSSLPLEYEIGKILTANNFFIDFDYSYKRFDNALEKEFSVDVKAGGFFPFEEDKNIELAIDLVLECKYRNPSISWVFVKDFNPENYHNFSLKGVIKLVDEFSRMHANDKWNTFPLCERCLKGVEVNTSSGEVHDKGIIHGQNQLIYSLPSILKSNISSALYDHIEDVYPFIICPILVTTADLRILKNDFSINKLKQCSTLDEVSSEVPYLKLYSDVYPSFSEHCKNQFAGMPNDNEYSRYRYFQDLRAVDFDKPVIKKLYSNPEILLSGLSRGVGNDIFKEILVCNSEHFKDLLQELKTCIEGIAHNLEKII